MSKLDSLVVICIEFESRRLIGAITQEGMAALSDGTQQRVTLQYPVEVTARRVEESTDRRVKRPSRAEEINVELQYTYLPTADHIHMAGQSMVVNVSEAIGFYEYAKDGDKELTMLYNVEVDGIIPPMSAINARLKQRPR